jgi:hypothetical protein
MHEIDYNNAQSNRWYAVIDGFEGIKFRLARFTAPGLSIDNTSIKHEGDVMVTIPGDILNIDPIEIEFIVDAKWRNYFCAYRWMRKNLSLPEPDIRDITLLLLDNQGKPQGTEITYKDCYPISLRSVEFDAAGKTHDIVMSMGITLNDIDMTVRDDDGTALTYP